MKEQLQISLRAKSKEELEELLLDIFLPWTNAESLEEAFDIDMDCTGIVGALANRFGSLLISEPVPTGSDQEPCDECQGTRFPEEAHEEHCSLYVEDDRDPPANGDGTMSRLGKV